MKKNKLKGMSLIEIIISLAVMALLSIILLTVGTTIDNTNKATNKLKNKIVQQSPYAASRNTVYKGADGQPKELDGKDITINVKIEKTGSYLDYAVENVTDPDSKQEVTDANNQAVTQINTNSIVEYTYANPEAEIAAQQYNTKDVVNGGPNISKANENLNLKFINFSSVGETPTGDETPGETPAEDETPGETPAEDETPGETPAEDET